MSKNKKETIEIVENSDDDFLDGFVVESNNKIGKNNKKNNDINFIDLCNKFEEELTTNFRKQREDIRSIKKMYQKEVKKNNKHKNKGNMNETAGINKPTTVPDKLADLIGIKRGAVMPRTKVGSLIYNEFGDRGLLYSRDKRVMRVDNELKQIFNVDIIVNNSTNPKDKVDVGINFYNLHSYIKRCYDEHDNNTQNKNIKTSS